MSKHFNKDFVNIFIEPSNDHL